MRIRPFRAYRYAGGSDLTAVVAPPYDQISETTRERLLALSPHNIVRITLPRAPDAADPYTSARRVLDRWLADGVWVPDAEPAVYPYHQTYRVGTTEVTRGMVIALGEVSEYDARVVRPHERTHPAPKQDRLRLLEATRADTGLLFMLVSDPEGELAELTRPTGPPLAQARDLRGELHRLWRITEPEVHERLAAFMASRSVIIADGHHRYETAVEYRRRHPEARWKLMAFCALEGPGLTIWPNHRLVHGLPEFSLARLAAAARPWFEVSELPDPRTFTPRPDAFGVVAREGARVFRLREEARSRLPWPASTSEAWRRLAVSVLHEGVLRPLLGITDADLDARTRVDYVEDQQEAVRLVELGRYQAAFLIAPTTPAELRAVVEGGEVLPHKSTHFYPKLLDGLVFFHLDAP